MALRAALLLTLAAGAIAAKVTPVEKVVSLITDMKNEVAKEGKEEAATYDTFACFCRDKTAKKSKSVQRLNKNIGLAAADIADKTQTKRDDMSETDERKDEHEKMSKELDETNARCAKEKAAYEAEAADLNKAISSLKSAIKAMKSSGGGCDPRNTECNAASLLEIASVSTSIVAKKLAAKVDPANPEYGYHSKDIVDLCVDLLGEFKSNKQGVDGEWSKTSTSCKETKKSLKNELSTNTKAMNALGRKIETLAKEIAETREDLVEFDGSLKDDQLYLKDLTARCEDRANDYDQRSQMRGGELKALETALEIITKKVVSRESDRAAFFQIAKANDVKNTKASLVLASAPMRSLSFLQGALEKQHSNSFLARVSDDLSLEAKKNRALSGLRSDARRIGSMALSALAVRMAADPFKKIKGLIQGLIERLLEESKGEATKKGFCDEALASAKSERDTRWEQSNDLNRELRDLEAKEDELTEEIEVLTRDIKDETKDLKETTDDRAQEKDDNLKAIDVAKDGLAAVSEALMTLKSFYSSAAKAAAFIQASPVDEQDPGAAVGSYKGNQGGMKAVFLCSRSSSPISIVRFATRRRKRQEPTGPSWNSCRPPRQASQVRRQRKSWTPRTLRPRRPRSRERAPICRILLICLTRPCKNSRSWGPLALIQACPTRNVWRSVRKK